MMNRPNISLMLRFIIAMLATIAIAACHLAPDEHAVQSETIDLLDQPDPAHATGFSRANAWRAIGKPNAILRPAAKDRPADIQITNDAPEMAGLRRLVFLFDGWYEFSGEIRTENVSDAGAGARLILEVGEGIMLPLPTFHGTTDWKKVDFFFMPGHMESRMRNTLTLSCQLGGYNQPSSGTAYFRSIRVSSITGRPPAMAARFNGDKIEMDPAVSRRRRPNRTMPELIGLILACGIAAGAGWRLMSPRRD